ncbi:MAG: double zinc ribbon domain-containing protein [Oscillospiraceae bacterium]|nr:double zinc ribbon domain-containing protein [Oscillospiraceae bacterium]
MIYNKYSSGIDRIIDIFLPNRCPFCDDFIPYNALACDACEKRLPLTEDSCCPFCGRAECICADDILYYSRCFSAAFYVEPAITGIHDLKFHHGVNAAYVFGDIIREKLEKSGALNEIDCVMGVPMSAKGLRRRGYNQADIIAARIVKGTQITVLKGVIERKYSKVAQHFLCAEERKKAAAEQYYIGDGDTVKGKTVLLCDDVTTTGSTINRCAQLLIQCGASEVIAAVCTVGKGIG